MDIVHAVILGIAQGLTEFLPISSSAHLVIIPQILGWLDQPLVFDTTLHLGTAAALILFFWRDLVMYYGAVVKDFIASKFSIGAYTREGKFALILLVSAIPAGLVGVLAGDAIEALFTGVAGEAAMLVVGSAIMLIAELFFAKALAGDLVQKVTVKKSLFIGAMQSLALFPGISRSGSTISAGMFAGLSRQEAARFSFLASVPIVLMAGIFQIIKTPQQLLDISLQPVLAGFFASFIVGVLVIKFLLGFLRTKSLYVFIVYRLILAVSLFAIFVF